MIKQIVEPLDDGIKLVPYLQKVFPEQEIKNWRQQLRSGSVRVNGVQVNNVKLCVGDEVVFYSQIQAAQSDIFVEYEDENIIVINKPAEISMVSNNKEIETVYTFACRHMRKTGQYSVDALNVPYLCQRVDDMNAGLVMVAKNEIYFNEINQALRQRRIQCFGQVVVSGIPGRTQGELHDYAEISKGKVIVSAKVKRGLQHLVTRYQVLAKKDDISLLEVYQVTGSNLMLRAHLQYFGHPVLGEPSLKKLNKRYGVGSPAVMMNRLVFSVGPNNPLEYLKDQKILSTYDRLPNLGFIVSESQTIIQEGEYESGNIW